MGRTSTLGGCDTLKTEQSQLDDAFDESQGPLCPICNIETYWCDGCQDEICQCSPCDC